MRWIKALMIFSGLLLLLLTGHWLYSQFRGEKEQLRKDLSSKLRETMDATLDSVILVTMVDTLTDQPNEHHNNKNPLPLVGQSYIELEAISDTTVHVKRMSYPETPHIDGPDGGTYEYVTRMFNAIKPSKDSVKVSKVFGTGIELIIRKAINMQNKSEDFPINKSEIERAYKASIHAKINGFKLKLSTEKDSVSAAKAGDIFISERLLSTNFPFTISNYYPFLIKKIIPQILFSILLLSITCAAFVFTYRSLKAQIKLSMLKNEFISNMSHELKTPVATVKVALEALNDYGILQQPEKAKEYINMAMLETNRLNLLIDRSLNTSMLEEGRIQIVKQACDVYELASELISTMRLRLEKQGAIVQLNKQGFNLTAFVDKLHVQGVILNVFDNSLKYNDKTPVIHITVIEEADRIKITMSDNGPGIPSAYIRDVFDKFFRVPSGDKHNVKGYGLGLNYARHIMELHGGVINVVNNPDEGCMFSLLFPKAEA